MDSSGNCVEDMLANVRHDDYTLMCRDRTIHVPMLLNGRGQK